MTASNRVCGQLRKGQTQAVGALARCLRSYGRETLITALQCITETSDGNAGFLRATIIDGLCRALVGTTWRDSGEALLRAMDDFSFPDAWDEIAEGRDKIFPATACRLFSEKVRAHLTSRLPDGAGL